MERFENAEAVIAAYERAVNGWDEPIIQGGKLVGHKRRYSDVLLKLLLQRQIDDAGRTLAANRAAGSADDLIAEAERAAKAAGGFFCTPATQAETDAALMKKLNAIARRVQAEDAAKASG